MARERPTASNDSPLLSGVQALTREQRREDRRLLVARKRLTASHERPVLVCLDGARPDSDGRRLTRAEAKAMRASASQTHHELTEHLQVVRDQPLHSV